MARSLPKTIILIGRSSGLWEAYTKSCPKWDKICTTACWCRSMIACQVSWISDEFWIYWNLKTTYINVCARVTVVGCVKFIPKGGTFPTENHHACFEKLRFVRSIYPNLPQMGQNLYHGMLMPLHDSMPSFTNFIRVLDWLEFKTRHLNVMPAINGAMVFEIHSHSLHGT